MPDPNFERVIVRHSVVVLNRVRQKTQVGIVEILLRDGSLREGAHERQQRAGSRLQRILYLRACRIGSGIGADVSLLPRGEDGGGGDMIVLQRVARLEKICGVGT